MNIDVIKQIKKISKTLKVLYVEDDVVIAKEIQKLLSKLFHNITYVEDGEKGLNAYKKETYDLVITDISMPNMDGISMIQEIKKLNKDQIVIVISAYNDSEKLTKLINLGVDRFIMKPLNINLFLHSVSKITVNLYNEKHKLHLEVKEKKDKHDKTILLDGMIAPIAIIERGIISYVNENFKNKFSLEEEIQYYKLSNIFENSDLKKMQNSELVEHLYSHQKKSYSILIAKKVQNYSIKVTKMEHSAKIMCCFFNLEDINKELSKIEDPKEKLTSSIDAATGLLLRSEFSYALEQLLDDELSYGAICFGLKHIEDYVKSFGVSSLEKIYKKFGQYLVHNFANLLELQVMELYYFNTNKFVLLVQEEYIDEVTLLLKSFGETYRYSNTNSTFSQQMSVDTLFVNIDKSKSVNGVISDIESKLYMLID